MSYPTVSEIMEQVLIQIGQTGGSGVQQYTEPVGLSALNTMFAYLYNKYQWPHLWSWQTKTLDGTTGRVSSDITSVREYLDIVRVVITNTEEEIPMPSSYEHTRINGGTTPLFRTVLSWDDAQADTRFFQFWPITATGSVSLLCGNRPATFEGNDDIVPMNKELIIAGTVWNLLSDDGLNPASAEKAQVIFDLMYQDIIARLGAKTIGRGGSRRHGSTVFISP